MVMITTPLANSNDVLNRTKLEWTTELVTEINSFLREIDGLLWSYVGNRYKLDNFTEDNLDGSKALELLKFITVEATAWKLLMSAYGLQMLHENINANYLYEQQVKIMKSIGDWTLRLLDKNNLEFELVPLPNKSNNWTPSTFGKRRKKDFRVWDER